MAAAVASLRENLQSVNEALEEYTSVASSCGLLPASENHRLQGHSISDHKCNTAAALARSTDGEFLEGLPISGHERNMAAAVTSLIGNFHTENEGLEGLSIADVRRNMAAPVASLTENLQSLNEALEKAKNHLLQRVQNLDGKIDELREVSKLNEGTKRNMAGAVGNLIDNLRTVNEAPEGLSIAEHTRKMAAELASFTKNKRKRACVNEAIEHYGLQKAKKCLLQRIQILDEKDDQQVHFGLEEAKKPISQRRRELEEAMGVLEEKQEDEMTEFESFKEATKSILQRRRELEEAMGVLVEKQEDEMTELESFEEAKKPISQRRRELEEAMGVLEEEHEDELTKQFTILPLRKQRNLPRRGFGILME